MTGYSSAITEKQTRKAFCLKLIYWLQIQSSDIKNKKDNINLALSYKYHKASFMPPKFKVATIQERTDAAFLTTKKKKSSSVLMVQKWDVGTLNKIFRTCIETRLQRAT